jgi:hypothetical protein
MLQILPVEMSPTKGLYQMADRRSVPIGFWLTLDNVVFDASGACRKRDGYVLMNRSYQVGGTLTIGDPAPTVLTLQLPILDLATRDTELLAYSAAGPFGGPSVYSWSPANGLWKRQDSSVAFSVRVTSASSIAEIQYNAQTALVTDATSLRTCRLHFCQQGLVNVSTSPAPLGSFTLPFLSAVDVGSGTILFPDTLMSARSVILSRLMPFPPAGGADGFAGVLSSDHASTGLWWSRVTPFAPTIGAAVNLTGNIGMPTPWDCHEANDNHFIIAFAVAAAGSPIHLQLWDASTEPPALVASNTVPTTAGSKVDKLSVTGNALGFWLAWHETGPGAGVFQTTVVQTNPGLFAQWTRVVDSIAGNKGNNEPNWISIGANAVGDSVISFNRGNTGEAYDRLRCARLNILGGIVQTVTEMVNVTASTRPTYVAGQWVCGATTKASPHLAAAPGGVSTGPIISTMTLLRLDSQFGEGAPFLAGLLMTLAVPENYYTGWNGDAGFPPLVTHVPVDISVDDVTTPLVGTFDVARQNFLVGASGFTTTNVHSIEIDGNEDLPTKRATADVALALATTGSYLGWYDGSAETEVSFAHGPEISNLTPVVIGPPTWEYCAVYEWTDDLGNLHQSAPGVIASSGQDPGAAPVSLIVQTIGATRKGRPVRGSGRDVQVAIYRTDANGGIFKRLFQPQNAPLNNSAATTITVVDNVSDATLDANAYGFLYTTGGALANKVAPGARAQVVFGNRLWAVPPEDDKVIRFSKEFISGEAPGFNEGLEVRLDDSPDGVTALVALDDKLIIFTASRCYYLSGQGPADTGQGGQFNGPYRIQNAEGCVNAKSVVSYPGGAFFQGARGLYNIDRALNIKEVGEVRREMAGTATILTTDIDSIGHRIRFLVSETNLSLGTRNHYIVYDYSLDLWTTEHPYYRPDRAPVGVPDLPTASTVWQGKHVQATKNQGLLMQGIPVAGAGYDNDTYAPSFIETPWVHFSSSGPALAGFQRVVRAAMVGQKNGPHTLTMDVSHNYDDAIAQTADWDVTTTGSLLGLPREFLSLHVKYQVCTAAKITISDRKTTATAGAGAVSFGGFEFAALQFELGVKPGTIRLPPQNKG